MVDDRLWLVVQGHLPRATILAAVVHYEDACAPGVPAHLPLMSGSSTGSMQNFCSQSPSSGCSGKDRDGVLEVKSFPG